MSTTSGGIVAGLFLATLLMVLFRQRYPRWWFDFARELTRISAASAPTSCCSLATTPQRPTSRTFTSASTHYVVPLFLAVAAFVVVVIACFVILFTGRYPRGMFDFVVGVGRWALRVNAYAFLLVTDEYPPFHSTEPRASRLAPACD